MNITDGIRINDLHSYHNFGLYIKLRNVGLPEKKSIRQTVPFMNGYYDFSALYGAPAWNERIIEYAFDILADTPQELEREITKILDWLCNVHDEDIFDDTLTRFHWHGSYESSDVTYDDSGMQAEIKVSFVVYPFKISDEATVHTLVAGSYTITNFGMAVAPYVISNASVAIQIGNYVSSIPANESIHLKVDLARGDNTVIIAGEGTVTLSFFEEVL